MREPLEPRIRQAFLDDYREPPTDLRSALWSRVSPRPRRVVQRAVIFAVVAAVTVATVSLPRLAGQGPAAGRTTGSFIPDFGYRLVSSRAGGAGRTYLGTVPAGHEYGVFLSNTCATKVTPLRLPRGHGPRGAAG